MTKKTIQFFVKLIVVAVILFVFSFVVVMPQYGGNYQASMVDKTNRLQSIEGPKIVLLGNSNLAFGMNSERLSQLTGMPVVNMGLHGGVGNAFNESVAKLNVCEGDIYIIVHDNWSDNDTIKNPELAWITMENHPQLLRLIRWKDIPSLAKAFPTYLRKCVHMWGTQTGNAEQTNAYRRSAFNEYGDNIYPRPQTEGEIELEKVTINPVSDVAANRVKKLQAYLEARGATLYVAGYPICVSDKTPTEAEYDAFEADLKQKLGHTDAHPIVISHYNDYRYDLSYFYDSYLHLTDAGIILRTDQLYQDITNVQPQMAGSR